MEPLDLLRFFLGAAMLCYGSWTDLTTRRVPNTVWLYSGSLASLILIYDLSSWWTDYGYHIWALLFSTIILFYNAFVDEYILDKNQMQLWRISQGLAVLCSLYFFISLDSSQFSLYDYRLFDLISIPLLIILMYVWFYFGPTIGGADVKAIMTLSLVAPFTFSFNEDYITAFETRGFPYPFVIFMNSLLLYLCIPFLLFGYNILKKNFEQPYFQMFFGTKMDLRQARDSFVWPMQQAIGDKVVFVAFIQQKSNDEEKWDELEKIGIKEPWVSLKIPYIIPLALSFFVSAFFGDLFSHCLVSPINSLFS